jgi:hypothetical protein
MVPVGGLDIITELLRQDDMTLKTQASPAGNTMRNRDLATCDLAPYPADINMMYASSPKVNVIGR